MAKSYTLTAATGVFTVSDNFDDTETCVVGGKTYTINATVGATDGSVHLGDDAEGTLANLAAAINLTPLAGETGVADADYASGMTINAEVFCTAVDATTLTVRAYTPGAVGNLIASTDTHGEGSWGAAVLEGGAGHVSGWITNLIALNQIPSEMLTELLAKTAAAD
jgi:hypothetical protein